MNISEAIKSIGIILPTIFTDEDERIIPLRCLVNELDTNKKLTDEIYQFCKKYKCTDFFPYHHGKSAISFLVIGNKLEPSLMYKFIEAIKYPFIGSQEVSIAEKEDVYVLRVGTEIGNRISHAKMVKPIASKQINHLESKITLEILPKLTLGVTKQEAWILIKNLEEQKLYISDAHPGNFGRNSQGEVMLLDPGMVQTEFVRNRYFEDFAKTWDDSAKEQIKKNNDVEMHYPKKGNTTREGAWASKINRNGIEWLR